MSFQHTEMIDSFMPVAKKKKKLTAESVLNFDLSLRAASQVELVVFAKHLALMLRSGLPISETLKIVYQSASGRFKKVIGDVYAAVKAGRSLAAAFKLYPKVFGSFFVGAVLAGENSGTLDNSLDNVANQLKKDKDLSDKIKGALMYPVIILLTGLAMALFLAFYILPKIVPLFIGLKMRLPWTTRLLIAFGQLVERYGSVLLVSILIGLLLLVWLARQKFAQPVTHWLTLYSPVIKSMTREANLARFSRTLGTLLASGLNIVDALAISAHAATNYYYRRVLLSVKQSVSRGNRLAAALSKSSLFPEMAVSMLAVGEESGRLEETLFYLADFYEEEVDNAAKNLATVIEPILLVIIGLGVGFLALSIITPIYSITGSVSR